MTGIDLEVGLSRSEAQREEARLAEALRAYQKAAIAFSGGVDSALVLSVARDVMGDGAVAITAVSESLSARELEACRSLAGELGARHVLVPTSEVADERYAANTPSRCYWCKDVVYAALTDFASEHDLGPVLDGMNRDDTLDHRPGRKAAEERGVASPLYDAGLGKAAVRAVARLRGLAVWNKPAMACLSSRIPHGDPVTAAKLAQIESAEDVLADLGITQYRVRHHGSVARIEVDSAELGLLLQHRTHVDEKLKALGFDHVAIDLGGYKQGSLTAGLRRAG